MIFDLEISYLFGILLSTFVLSRFAYHIHFVSSSSLQIFFDDNIEREYAHIVDVRDRKSFKPIPFHVSKDLLLRRVEPYLAITQLTYFIDEIDQVLKLYNVS